MGSKPCFDGTRCCSGAVVYQASISIGRALAPSVDALSHCLGTTGLAFSGALQMLMGDIRQTQRASRDRKPEPRYPDHGDFLARGSGIIPK